MPPVPTPGGHCPVCGSPVAADQRYCLECGERQVPRSSFLMSAPVGEPSPQQPPAAPPSPPAAASPQRSGTLTALAGIGLLLLAMGVGVLIGRAGVGKQSAPPAQVITVAGTSTSTGTSTTQGSETSFTSTWPSGKTGYTVQLETLAASTSVSAVEAAKTAASTKGAKEAGALKAEEFSSLSSTSGYVIYSGVYSKRSEAEKAKSSLTHSFPSATVIEVSSKSSSAESAGSGSTAAEAAKIEKAKAAPAPKASKKKGKSYEEESKALPEEVETK